MNRRIRVLCFLLGLSSILPAFPARAAYKVIVRAGSGVTQASRSTLQGLFLKNTTRWADGTTATPVDQTEKSKVRQEFSREVLGRDPAAVKSYWLTMVFSGRGTPPTEMASDEKVIETVSRTNGAVGYVSEDAKLPDGVRVITVTK